MKLLGKAEDPNFWSDTVRNTKEYEVYRTQLNKQWEQGGYAERNFEALGYSDFKLYWATGNRNIYESKYFARRTALEVTVPLALIYPEEEKYIERIMDWVYIICDEYTWCLPAHQGQLDPLNECRIDLFAAETAFNLAIIHRLLYGRLDPLIRARIEREISRRVIEPFLATECYGWWETGHSNWTAVCAGNVGCATMLMRPELMTDELIGRLDKSMLSYLDGFKDDGVCLEGCGYWAYGVSYFVQYADMIRTFTGGRVDYFKHPRLPAIATFPQKMFLSDTASVSFADGGRTLNYSIGVTHRLKDEYPSDVLVYSPEYATYSIGCGRLAVRIHSASWLNPEYYNNPADSTTAFETYAEDSQWYVRRTAAYGFAAKAGHNDELHNHNDVGSFIFAKAGKQLLADLGSGTYTRQYFDAFTRYYIVECAAFGHSLPIINGAFQSAGRSFAASDVSYADGCFSMDIAGAYECKGLRSLRRSFRTTETSVTLTDEIDYTGRGYVVERIVSVTPPELLSPDTVRIGEATVRFDPVSCSLAINETNGTKNNNEKIYFLDFTLKKGVRLFTLTVE